MKITVIINFFINYYIFLLYVNFINSELLIVIIMKKEEYFNDLIKFLNILHYSFYHFYSLIIKS